MAAEYQDLYSQVQMLWQNSGIDFYITSLMGNQITIDYDDQNTPSETIETTGGQQRIRKSFSNSKERRIVLKGSGVYTLSNLNTDGEYDDNLKCIYFTRELPNLKNLKITGRYFQWLEQPDWSLTPNLIQLYYYYCRERLYSIDFSGNNKPPKLQRFRTENNYYLSSIIMPNYNTLKSVHFYNCNSDSSFANGDINISGCSNLTSAYFYNDKMSGLYLNDCQKLKTINFADGNNSNMYYTRMLDISNDIALTGLNIRAFGTNYNYSISGDVELVRKNNTKYQYEYFRDCAFNKGMMPEYQNTPNLSSLYWNECHRCSGQLNLSEFQKLTRVSLQNCYSYSHEIYDEDYNYIGTQLIPSISAVTCLNNRALSSLYVYRCYNIQKANIQNNSQLYDLEINANEYNSNTGQPSGNLSNVIIKNNPRLYDVNLNYNSLKYNFELKECPNIYYLYMNYTQLNTLQLSDLTNLYSLECYASKDFDSKLRNVKLTRCYRNNSNTQFRLYRLNNVRQIEIDDVYKPSYVQTYQNPNLEKLYVTNTRCTSFDSGYYYYMFQNNPSLKYVDFTNNMFSKDTMNKILDYLNQYIQYEGGTIIFSGNQYGYRPDDSYIDNVFLNKGWNVIIN